MSSVKVDISVEEGLLAMLDRWVAEGRYADRSAAIEALLREKDQDARHLRLAAALALADPAEEQQLAEEWLAGEEWPEY